MLRHTAVLFLGGHETSDWPCHAAKVASCGRKCGRRLECGNHCCMRECHRVKNAPDDIHCGSNCRKCESECQRSRSDGCPHPCSKPCHPEPCDECKQMIRFTCHCGLSQASWSPTYRLYHLIDTCQLWTPLLFVRCM